MKDDPLNSVEVAAGQECGIDLHDLVRDADDARAPDQSLQRKLVNRIRSFDKMRGSVDMSARVRSKVEHRDVGRITFGEGRPGFYLHAGIAFIDRHGGPDRNCNVEDFHWLIATI